MYGQWSEAVGKVTNLLLSCPVWGGVVICFHKTNASSSVLQPLSSASWAAGSWQQHHPLPHFPSQAVTPVQFFFSLIALDCYFYSAFLRALHTEHSYIKVTQKSIRQLIQKAAEPLNICTHENLNILLQYWYHVIGSWYYTELHYTLYLQNADNAESIKHLMVWLLLLLHFWLVQWL